MAKRQKKMTAEQVWSKLNGGDMVEAGIFCCALALADGLSPAAIKSVCSLDDATIDRLLGKARECGLVVDNHVECEWMDPETGGIALIMDSLVLEGLVQRV